MDRNVFLIKWYGPFKDEEEEKDWEENHSFKCSLYLLHGKKSGQRRDLYYCGMSMREVYHRLRDKDHHINEIKDRMCSIYVGCIANVRRVTKGEVALTEKLITACLVDCVGEGHVLNQTNMYYPQSNAYIINEWWKPYNEGAWERQPRLSPPSIIPDVLAYHFNGGSNNDLFGAKKLKRL